MAKNLLDLANSMDRRAKAYKEAASKLAIDAALTIVGDLAYKTPVDTSKAISNWIVSVGSSAGGTIQPHFPGYKGSTYRASAAETIDAAKNALKNKKPGETIFITNSLPYIRKLNDGSSVQQPAGFVQRAVLLGRIRIRKAEIKV